MTSKNVNSLVMISATELRAMLKLVQMACHGRQFMTLDKLAWISYCMTAFGWDSDKATHVIESLRKRANRELTYEELVVQQIRDVEEVPSDSQVPTGSN